MKSVILAIFLVIAPFYAYSQSFPGQIMPCTPWLNQTYTNCSDTHDCCAYISITYNGGSVTNAG